MQRLFSQGYERIGFATAIFELDSGRCLSCNPAFTALLGYQSEDIVGRTDGEIGLWYNPVDRSRMVAEIGGAGQINSWWAMLRTRTGEQYIGLIDGQLLTVDGIEYALLYIADGSSQRAALAKSERLARRARVLADLSQVLAASWLDYRATLTIIARDVALLFGDLCIVRLLDTDAVQLTLAAVHHPNPSVVERFQQIAATVTYTVANSLTGRAVLRGAPTFMPQLTAQKIGDMVQPAYHPFIVEADLSGMIGVALRAQGRVVGTLSLWRQRSAAAFVADDLELLQDLADRAALAIVNAKLYQESQQEIAERRKVEERLRRREREFVTLVERSPDVIFRLDRALRFRYINQRTDHYYDSLPHPIIGQHLSDVGLTDDVVALLTACAEHVFGTGESARQVISLLVEVRPGEASHFDFEVSMVAEPSDDEQGATVIGVARDITELTAASGQVEALNQTLEQRVVERTAELSEALLQLRVSEQRYRAVVEDQVELICRYNGDYIVSFINDALCRRLGHTAAAIIGRRMPIDIPEEDLPLIGASLRSLGRERQSVTYEHRMVNPGGQIAWLHRTDRAIFDRSGVFVEYQTVALDITDRKRTEEALASSLSFAEQVTDELGELNIQLARAVRLKDEFLANMSHELRTPLNAVLGRAEMLLEQMPGPLNERQLRAVRSIFESGHHLLALINDILDLSKIEAGKIEIQPSPIAIADVCAASVRMINETAMRKQLRVSVTIDERLSTALLDELRLKQILVNLLSNAVKFTPEGGSIGIDVTRIVGEAGEASEADEMIRFTVWDTGIGIGEHEQARLFKPFVQLDAGLARRYSGTGLGLALVARLTALHGGAVEVISAPGAGAQFLVTLPLVAADDLSAVVSAVAAPFARRDSSPLVLVVEDHQENVDFLHDALTGHGCSVIVARDGLAAVAMARSHRPNLILMDIQMPGMDGIAAIQAIRAIDDIGQVPIVAITALTMPGDRERCIAAGAAAYIAKPISLATLRAQIERFIPGVTSRNLTPK